MPGPTLNPQAMADAYMKSQGIDPSALQNPNAKNLAKQALVAYLVSQGIPPEVAGPLADAAVDKIAEQLPDGAGEDPVVPAPPVSSGVLAPITLETPKLVDKSVETLETPPGANVQKLDHVVKPTEHEQLANEAVDIDRKTKDAVKGFLPPMNWWDKLPDWPVYSYTAIMLDQTRASKKFVTDGLPSADEVELEIESRKYPYKSDAVEVLKKGKVDPTTRPAVLGTELDQPVLDKDTVKDTKSAMSVVPRAIVNTVTQTNTHYFPVVPIWDYPEVYRDDLTDQKNPALDLVDMQKLVDEFLDIGKRIYDQESENPTIFGFDDINSTYEKDKNVVLANYKQFKTNVHRMEHLNNIIENNSNKYLIEKINYRHDVTNCSNTEEFWTRYLREKLLAWYNETDDPETKIWGDHHWLPGEPGYIEMLLTVGDWEWYDNMIAGAEDSIARLEDLEATLDLIASMGNVLGTIEDYMTDSEMLEIAAESQGTSYGISGGEKTKVEKANVEEKVVIFTHDIIDQTMLKDLLGVAEIIGDFDGELTPLRATLESLREQNQAILEELRIMSPTFLSYPIIWTRLDELCSQVIADIHGPLNTLILDRRGDFETVGKHSSPSHLELHIHEQLAMIVETIHADVQNIIDKQAALPTMGFNRLDSMLNKLNEIRYHGPLCSIPFRYQVAIDNVNAAERLYNDIWSDVFDCWEREYITRVWRVVTEHHIEGVIPATYYGKPLFSAECPHHLPLLLAPVPVDYRDIDINYLSANCRKHFNFMASWLTSALYAIGVKRVALGNVINDTSLNGNDENIPFLAELNTLNDKNIALKKAIDEVIAEYNGTGPLLQKREMDEIVAAKELSPRLFSNQVLMNMSSELHILNTDPVTELKVSTNENRTGTVVKNSESPEWDAHVAPAESSARPDLIPAEAPAANVTDTLITNTILTVGGDAEIIEQTDVSADNDASTKGSYVGDIPEFEPWHYGMTPDWDTQRTPPEIPPTVPPEVAPVIPTENEILDPTKMEQISNKPAEIADVTKDVIKNPDMSIAKSILTPVEMNARNITEGAKMKVDGFRKLFQTIRTGMAASTENATGRKQPDKR